MSQEAFDSLKAVETDLATVNEALDRRRGDPACKGTERSRLDAARSQTEKTYLLRLLAEFEGALTRIGPTLHRPARFTKDDGLRSKMNQIGKKMGIDSGFRGLCDDEIGDHRNELAHGKSPVPRVSFDRTHSLMKQFLRSCR